MNIFDALYATEQHLGARLSDRSVRGVHREALEQLAASVADLVNQKGRTQGAVEGLHFLLLRGVGSADEEITLPLTPLLHELFKHYPVFVRHPEYFSITGSAEDAYVTVKAGTLMAACKDQLKLVLG